MATIDTFMPSNSRREQRLSRYGCPIPHLGSFRGELGYQRDIVPIRTPSNVFHPPLLDGQPVSSSFIPSSRNQVQQPFPSWIWGPERSRSRSSQETWSPGEPIAPMPEAPKRLLPWPARAPTATVSRPPPSPPRESRRRRSSSGQEEPTTSSSQSIQQRGSKRSRSPSSDSN